MTEVTEHFGGDYGVTVVFTLDPDNAHFVTFFAAEIVGRGVPDDAPLYTKKDATVSCDHVEDPRKADRFASGSVKWDGCSHVNVGDDNGYIHMCGREAFDTLATVLPAIYERCGELMQARGVRLLEGEFKVSALVQK